MSHPRSRPRAPLFAVIPLGAILLAAPALVAGSDGAVWLRQGAKGVFERRTLAPRGPRHATIAAGDFDRDGDVDLVLGTMATASPSEDWVEVWEVVTER